MQFFLRFAELAATAVRALSMLPPMASACRLEITQESYREPDELKLDARLKAWLFGWLHALRHARGH